MSVRIEEVSGIWGLMGLFGIGCLRYLFEHQQRTMTSHSLVGALQYHTAKIHFCLWQDRGTPRCQAH